MTAVAFFDARRQVEAVRAELDKAVRGVLDSGRFILGPEVEAFEREFAAWCGANHAVGVASGTDALALALLAVGVEAGDEVIAPANTCVPTVAAIASIGAVPILADVEAATLTLSPESAAAVRTARTRAVVPVHLYGLCADVDAIRAALPGVLVVEDAAQGHGAALRGRRAGTLGEAAAFSFYPTKNLPALGDGGAVVTDDAEVAARARRLRAYGETDRYHSVEEGRNSRLDEVQAAVLRVRLRGIDAANDRRRALAARYDEWLPEASISRVAAPPGFLHARHLYVVRLRDRDALRESLLTLGVETLVHYPRPVHGHPAYASLATPLLRESELASAEVLSLPLYPELSEHEVETVAAALTDLAGRSE